MPSQLRLSTFVLMSLVISSTGLAHTPVDFLEVFTVTPARKIEHAVELKSQFDESKTETMLAGPEMFARAVGGMDRTLKSPRAYLSWFRIASPKSEPVRELKVLDMVRGTTNSILKIQSAEYMLSPTQRITSGAPEAIPDGLDHYKAYRIVEPVSLDRPITLSDATGPKTRNVLKPLFVCVPTSEWHHDDHFPATHPHDCFVVYQLDVHDHREKVSTIGQFGLNELQTTQSQWLCVRAALLRVDGN